MIEKLKIIPAGIRDLGNLQKLENICFEKDAWGILDLIGVLSMPDTIRLKVDNDRKMIAFAACDLRRRKNQAWIITICVHPDHRQQGIARGLLQACENGTALPSIRLCVRRSNTAAIMLYEHYGYQKIDTWKGYYIDKEDAIVYEKRR